MDAVPRLNYFLLGQIVLGCAGSQLATFDVHPGNSRFGLPLRSRSQPARPTLPPYPLGLGSLFAENLKVRTTSSSTSS